MLVVFLLGDQNRFFYSPTQMYNSRAPGVTNDIMEDLCDFRALLVEKVWYLLLVPRELLFLL